MLRHLAYLFLIILSDCRSCSCFPCFWFPVARLFHSINSYLSLYITHRAFEMTANFNQSEETDCWKKQRSTTTISLDVVNNVATAMSSSQRLVFVWNVFSNIHLRVQRSQNDPARSVVAFMRLFRRLCFKMNVIWCFNQYFSVKTQKYDMTDV